MYYIKIYLMIAIQDLKSKMSYRMDFLINTLSILITDILYLASFLLLYGSIESIGGWSLHQILFFYGIMLMSVSFMQTFFDHLWELDKKLISGEFIKYYYKPLNILFYFISERIDIKGIIQFIFGVGVTVYSIIKLDLQVTASFVLKMIICVLAAGIVYIGMMLLTSSLAFWFLNTITIIMFVSKSKDYARYPLSIYGKVLKFCFTVLFPIGFISYYPGVILLNEKIQYGTLEGTEKVPSYEKKHYKSYFLSIYNAFLV